MGLEKNLWEWLRDGTKKVRGLKLQRVENMVAKGVPDIYGHYGSSDFWIEAKACARPVRPTSLLKFEIYREQVIWLREWWKVGCMCFALVRVGREHHARVYLIEGDQAKALERCTESDLQALSILGSNRANQSSILHCVTTWGRGE